MARVGLHRVLVTFKKLVLMAGYSARAFARCFNLTPARIDVLLALQYGAVLQSDLAKDMAVTPPVVSRMLGALEGLGLVFRRQPVEDRRQRLVALTAHGTLTLEMLFDDFFVDDGSQNVQWGSEDDLICEYGGELEKAGVPVARIPNLHNRSVIWSMLHAVRTTKYYAYISDPFSNDPPQLDVSLPSDECLPPTSPPA